MVGSGAAVGGAMAEADALLRAGQVVPQPGELVEDAGAIRAGDARPVVDDARDHLVAVALHDHLDGPVALGVLHGVREQVGEHAERQRLEALVRTLRSRLAEAAEAGGAAEGELPPSG